MSVLINQFRDFLSTYSTKELIAAQLSAEKGFRVGDIAQWYLYKSADFSSSASNTGWTVPDVSVCGGIQMMGGRHVLQLE